ncbi:MAG: HAMP domain-containing histidine kinase [Polyangiaceae bacterium]|nr:HAMP domain-containing histidine kinase [Polyangiaceae bacterium]
MSGDRLTRTELSWLLTQEARAAAEKLRKGVGVGVGVGTTPPPPSTGTPHPPPSVPNVILPAVGDDTGVEGVLNRLDETMSMLSSLHGHSPRGRRGKIDVAALLWEIAPEARVQIAVDEGGLVVFGDEAELRRMLHVLMALGGDPTTLGAVGVSVKRDGKDIKIAVELGPDKSQGFETESQWLSRMAIRYGGHFQLEGNANTLVLPASDDQGEVQELRRELAAAQAQGEAYARELAAVMSSRSEPPPARTGGSSTATSGDGLAPLVGMARSLVTDVRGILAAIGRDMAPLRERDRWGERDAEIAEIASSVGRHVTAASEVVGDLARLAGCPLYELPAQCNVADVVRDVVKAEQIRAKRHGVSINLEVPSHVPDELLAVSSVHILFQELLDSAISVSPADSTIHVGISVAASGVAVMFDDAGPGLTAKARTGAINRDFDALVQERDSALPLIAAFAIAAHLHAPLTLEDSPHGGTRARVAFPRTTGSTHAPAANASG